MAIATQRIWTGVDAQGRQYALDLNYDDVTGAVADLTATVPSGAQLFVYCKDNVTGWSGQLTLSLGTSKLVVPGGVMLRTIPLLTHDPRLSFSIYQL